MERPDHINRIHSLTIDSTQDYLFTDVFESAPGKSFTAQYVNNRNDYYEEVKKLAADQDGLFYVVGSDEFILQNIDVLREQGIKPEQIVLDKRERQLANFFPVETTI